MKTGVLVLLLVTISLLASVESHDRGNKRGGGKRKGYSGGKRSWMKTICNNQGEKDCEFILKESSSTKPFNVHACRVRS